MNKKRARDLKAIEDHRVVGKKLITQEKEEGEPVTFTALFRSRKARRANARLNGADWRALSDLEKLSY